MDPDKGARDGDGALESEDGSYRRGEQMRGKGESHWRAITAKRGRNKLNVKLFLRAHDIAGFYDFGA